MAVGLDKIRKDWTDMNRLMGMILAALLVGALAGPVAAADGALAVRSLPGTINARDGELTLRLNYNCTQYPAPYDGSDTLGGSIYADGRGWATTSLTFVTCDGSDHRITLTLYAIDGGLSGPATLVLGHQGQTADLTAGYTDQTGNVALSITVKAR